MLSDWYHGEYYAIVKSFIESRPDRPSPTSDNNLINGKASFDCSKLNSSTYINGAECTSSAGYSELRFQAGKSHRLRLVNTGADASQLFSIDDHTMTIIANDFVPVEPYETNVVTLGIGQRTDVIVNANGDPRKSYWMRSTITCSNSNQPLAQAIIYYDQASNYSAPNTSAPQGYSNGGCANDPLEQTIPLYPIAISEPEAIYEINMSVTQNETGSWLWYMNNSSFFGDLSDPTLLSAKEGNISSDPQLNLYRTGSKSSYRFISRSCPFA
jgi:FtsP/CotA-like multicopper oxidase with cupredoxin domain